MKIGDLKEFQPSTYKPALVIPTESLRINDIKFRVSSVNTEHS